MLLGTAITQTFPRHPIAVAQQVQVLAQLAPERFRLGGIRFRRDTQLPQ
jgi:alkanesulfonate monooxygenase SsuD/methylene tetrahydromethanopterin reductase-like flavin-dependent oxidoreductase (luciferase family)